MISPPFTPSAGDHLVFLIGGGQSNEVGVELRVEDRASSCWRGLDSNELAFMTEDLTPHAGKICRVRIYDAVDAPWGHIQADHFMIVRPE